MNEDYVDQMRSFIYLSQDLLTEDEQSEITTGSEQSSEPAQSPILADLDYLTFRLRGFHETAGGDYALGVETGMQQAATMIENLVRRHREGGNLG